MKLEFLAAGALDCPLVRLYNFDRLEIERLLAELSPLASGERESVAVHDLPGAESISGCRLFLRSARKDRGMVQLQNTATFNCLLDPEGWDEVKERVQDFSGEIGHYQWLVSQGDAKWLLSPNGQW